MCRGLIRTVVRYLIPDRSAQTRAYAFARARLFTSAHCESKLPGTAEMAAKEAPENGFGVETGVPPAEAVYTEDKAFTFGLFGHDGH